MTIQEIQKSLNEALDGLSEIDSSETFAKMLVNPSFPVDEGDVSYLVHQLEVIISSVKDLAEKEAVVHRTVDEILALSATALNTII